MATREQAMSECLSVVKNQLAAKVLVDKYFLANEGNYTETTPQQMWERLAKANAKAETDQDKRIKYEKEFYSSLNDFRFVPAGRVLYGLGNPFVNVTLKNCYVIAIRDDSIKGIFQTAYEMAETYKSGGGCGIDITPLRPRGMTVHNAARTSSGSVSFMDFFSHITGMIGQNARIGALLISIAVDHPDIEEFISIKSEDLNKIRFANISVRITDEFMRAVQDNLDFDLKWGGKVFKTVKARELWNKIIHYAWKRAEPGLLFWDTIVRESPPDRYDRFVTVTTNPCGEAPSADGDSCNLGSINLGKYVLNSFRNDRRFDYVAFEKDTRNGVRFLDNIITLEKSPLEFQQWANDNGRKLGLGVMGLADALMRMQIRYDSETALSFADGIMSRFREAAYDESCNLAIEKGPFPIFEADRHLKCDYIKRLPDFIKDKIKKTGIRNIALFAIAPTGSLQCIAQSSPSIEPIFSVHHYRKTNLGTAKEVQEHEVWHPVAKEYAELNNITPDKLPDFFIGAHQVDPKFRVKMQQTVQQYIDQAISQTVNLPKDVKEEQIGQLYMDAWSSGLKGITVYRDGSREGVISTKKQEEPKEDEIRIHQAPRRPDSLDAVVHVIKPNGKKFSVFVGLLKGRVYEVFALDHTMAGLTDGMTGKIIKNKKDDATSDYSFESGAILVRKLNGYEDNEASLITRLVSTALRHGTPLEFLIDQISKSRVEMVNFAKAIARALSIYIKKEDVEGKFKCPKCGSRNIKFEGTCYLCLECGGSRCS